MSYVHILLLLVVGLMLHAEPCFAQYESSPKTSIFLTHSVGDQTYRDDNGQLRGKSQGGRRAFNVELVREMALLVGQVPDISVVPFKRGLQTVQSLPGYALFNVNRTTAREATVKWVGPLQSSTTHFYENKNAPAGIRSLEDAKKVEAICVLRGNVHHRFLEKQGFENIYPVNSYINCVDMLGLKRVSLTPLSNLSSLIRDKQHPASSFLQKTPVRLMVSEGFLVFSKETPDAVVEKWQDAYDKLVESGRYEQLVDQYLANEME